MAPGSCPLCEGPFDVHGARCPGCDAVVVTIPPTLALAEALLALPGRAVVLLAAGEYHLASTVPVGGQRALIGAGRDATFIQCGGRYAGFDLTGRDARFVGRGLALGWPQASGSLLQANAGEISLVACQLAGRRDAGEGYGCGVRVAGEARALLKNCEITGFAGAGLAIWGDATLGAVTCQITQNGHAGIDGHDRAVVNLGACQIARNAGSGLTFSGNASGEVRACIIENNLAHGIAVYGGSPLLEENIVRHHPKCGLSFTAEGADGGIARRNLLEANAGGMAVYGGSPLLADNVSSKNSGDGLSYSGTAAGLAQNNRCEGNTGHGLSLWDQAAPRLEGNTFGANARGDFHDRRTAPAPIAAVNAVPRGLGPMLRKLFGR